MRPGLIARKTNLYVCNTLTDVGVNGLKNVFTPFGNIVSARIQSSFQDGMSLGKAFVKYATVKEANTAIAGMLPPFRCTSRAD